MEVVTFRLANYETPLWSVENFAAGRYNAAGSGFTQYLSLHPLTPWAELLRNEDRRTRDRAVLMRYPLWAIRAQLADEPFHLTFDNAGDVGLDPGELVGDDFGPCQVAGRHLALDRDARLHGALGGVAGNHEPDRPRASRPDLVQPGAV